MAKKSLAEPLRDYQIDLIGQIEAAIANGHRRIMLQLPTGAGKTRCFVELAKNHQLNPYAGGVPNCLIIAHRKELIEQAVKALGQELGTTSDIGIIKAGYEPYPNRSIQVASIQSLIRRKFPLAGLVIVDEAHHATAKTYEKILEHYSQAIILGVTATPIRTDGKGFKDRFDILIKGPSIRELTAKQYLCPFRLFAYYIQRINLRNVSTRAGDFDLHQLADAVATSEVRADLVKTWEQYAKGKRTVVFAVNTKLSKEYAEAYCNAGYRAEHIDGETPEAERTAILTRFKEGKTQILCNCNIVTEGFDLPEMECVQIVRPTKSLCLWLQMVGRSLRYSEGKIAAIILDHTDNYLRLGLPDAKRNWTLNGIDRELPDSKGSIGDKNRKLPDHLPGKLIEVYSNLITPKTTRKILTIPKSTSKPISKINKDTNSNFTINFTENSGDRKPIKPKKLIIPRPTPEIPIIDEDTSSNFIENLGNGIELKMIAIPGGSFQMGDNELHYTKRVHRVNIEPFYLGKYQVTQEQYQAVMGKNPSHFKGDKLPVKNVSWNDAVEFCQKLSQKTGNKYRLPSESEWEYACRAGNRKKYCFANDEKQLGNYAWYIDNSNGETHPVGQKKPNKFGLYDMHGNVWEWCSDRWHESYKGAPTDGSSWETNAGENHRVLRGGSWETSAKYCRAGSRNRTHASNHSKLCGFRVAFCSFLTNTP